MGVTARERSRIIDAVPGGHDLREQNERTRNASASQRRCTLARWAFVILMIARFVGDITMPATVERFPLLLILLTPRWRMLLLVSRRLDVRLFFTFGLVRRLLNVIVLYRVGRYGIGRGRAFRSRTGPTRRWAQWLQEWFKRFAAVLLVLRPGAAASFIAGVQAMPLVKVVALASVGILARLLIVAHIGEAFSAPLDDVIRFMGRHHLQLTGLILTCVVVRALRTWVRIGLHVPERESTDKPSDQPGASIELADQGSDYSGVPG